MIPEHTAMLQQWVADQEDIKQPVLEEDQLEELNIILKHSWNDQRTIQIRYYKNKRFYTMSGTIQSIDPISNTLTLLDLDGQKTLIVMFDINNIIPC